MGFQPTLVGHDLLQIVLGDPCLIESERHVYA